MHIIRCLPKGSSVNFAWTETKFPYRGIPTRVRGASGDLLFVASEGRISGVAPILGIDPIDPKDSMDYLEQGSPIDPGAYRYLRVGKMKRVKGSPPYKGHVGIRYVDRLRDRAMLAFLTSIAKSTQK